MKLRKTIASTIIASMIANTMSWAFYISLINMVMTPRIYAADAIFDQLESNFNLANPNANRNATTSAQDIVEKYKNAIQARMSVGRSPRNTWVKPNPLILISESMGQGTQMKVS